MRPKTLKRSGWRFAAFQPVIVARSGQRRRRDDGAVDAVLAHHLQQPLDRERLDRPGRPLPWHPRYFRRIRLPDVHLRIDDYAVARSGLGECGLRELRCHGEACTDACCELTTG